MSEEQKNVVVGDQKKESLTENHGDPPCNAAHDDVLIETNASQQNPSNSQIISGEESTKQENIQLIKEDESKQTSQSSSHAECEKVTSAAEDSHKTSGEGQTTVQLAVENLKQDEANRSLNSTESVTPDASVIQSMLEGTKASSGIIGAEQTSENRNDGAECTINNSASVDNSESDVVDKIKTLNCSDVASPVTSAIDHSESSQSTSGGNVETIVKSEVLSNLTENKGVINVGGNNSNSSQNVTSENGAVSALCDFSNNTQSSVLPEQPEVLVGGVTPQLNAPIGEGTCHSEASKAEAKSEASADVAVKSVESIVECPSASSSSSKTSSDDDHQAVYHIKWIGFKKEQVPIITQNENGSCPLLAIVNTLLLRGKIRLPASTELITSNDLMAHLAECMFDHVPKNITPDSRLNYEQNMQDAIAVFPKLQTGLDVNVKFTGVSEFEYTPECIVFDLLNIPLYHGWLVDPQLCSTAAALGNFSYNQLVEKIIAQKSSTDDALATEALLAEEFLNTTASQLTYHGLVELSATLRDDEMCVLFRNNHFSTLYKYKDELFVLVTDQGLLRESSIVWETLNNVEGDGHFVDSDFHTYSGGSSSLPAGGSSKFSARVTETPGWITEQQPSVVQVSAASAVQGQGGVVTPVNSKEQIDQDYLVALSLAQDFEGGATGNEASVWPDSKTMELSDLELARQLQEEENRTVEAEQAAAAAAAAAGGASGGKQTQADKTQSSSGKEKGKDKDKSCLVM